MLNEVVVREHAEKALTFFQLYEDDPGGSPPRYVLAAAPPRGS